MDSGLLDDDSLEAASEREPIPETDVFSEANISKALAKSGWSRARDSALHSPVRVLTRRRTLGRAVAPTSEAGLRRAAWVGVSLKTKPPERHTWMSDGVLARRTTARTKLMQKPISTRLAAHGSDS